MATARKNIMLGTAGHVDHGKTALIKLLTGCETDTLAEEKQRGLTIDLGFAPCRMSDQRIVGIVDVPGHVDFIRNMVAGAQGIDVVILVIAADDGVMPQTREHLHILTLMGLERGLVALTKIDLVDEELRALVIEDVRSFLAGTFLERAPVCPLSNLTGAGFDGFADALNEVVNACRSRPCTGLFRVWVADVFSFRGSGTVVTGIPSSGVVKLNDRLKLQPAGLAGRVRRLQVYGEDATEGRAGECVAMNLAELDHAAVRRGMVLCEAEAVAPVTMVEAQLQVLDSVKVALADYTEVHLHVGTAAVLARVAMLEGGQIAPGDKQMVQLRLAEPLAIAPGERFVVRANAAGSRQSGLVTFGGGRVLGVSNLRLRRKRQWTLDALACRRNAIDESEQWCELMLRERAKPMALDEVARTCLLHAEEARPILERLRAQGSVVNTPGGAWVHQEAIRQATARLRAAVESFHHAHPQREGLERGELLSRVEGNEELLALALNSLLDAGQIAQRGAVWSLPGWQASLSEREQRLCADIAAALQQAGWTAPETSELAARLGEPLPRVEAMIQVLLERGLLLRLGERTLMHRDAIEAARRVALELFSRAPAFTTMEFRDALGVSRKYAVPLLDYLDATRFTARDGHNRTPGAEARRLMN
jgi:selenocysteine-specific elongation factor